MGRSGINHWQRIALAVLGIVCVSVAVVGCGPSASKPTAGKKLIPGSRSGDDGRCRGTSNRTACSRGPRATLWQRVQRDRGEHKSSGSGNKSRQRRLPPGFGPAQQPTGPRTFTDLLADNSDDGKAATEAPAAVSIPSAQEGARRTC